MKIRNKERKMFKKRDPILTGIFVLMTVFLVGCFGSGGGWVSYQ